MKALTINIHSHFPDMDSEIYMYNIGVFTKYIYDHKIDVFALQECCQTHDAEGVEEALPGFFVPCCEKTMIKHDNCAYLIAKELERLGCCYHWTWSSAKIGYDAYDEGLAVFCREPILKAEECFLSNSTEHSNWKTRKAVGVKTTIGGKKQWFYSVHMGWWNDEEEPFSQQMDRLQEHVGQKIENVFLMGDFNSNAGISGESYDYTKNFRWYDTYELAEKKDEGITVPGKIDGWEKVDAGMRIDYIWTREKQGITSSEVIFNQKNEKAISDHFGVIIDMRL